MKELSDLKRVKMYEMVANELKEYIIENRLKSGDRLPTEIELVRMLNVGRSSVREGIRYLQTLGIVDTDNRNGLVVKETNLNPIKDILKFHMQNNGIDHKNLFEAAYVVHLGIIPIIIDKINDEHINTLKQIIHIQELKTGSYKEFIESDYKFHVTLLKITENEIILQLIDIFNATYKNKLKKNFNAKVVRETIKIHKEILQSLVEKNLDKAIEAMLKHNNHHIKYNITS